jgi:uncharacterized protein (DUF488 family)
MLTIGHSTLRIETFVEVLRENGVRVLADIRTVPKSRHNPQFAQENLKPALEAAGIKYHWFRDLGGLRHTRKDSINTGWRNTSFRGYADYMQTPEFEQALDDLIALARERRTAIMCAEAVPWRCHRSLIADALLVRGIDAEEIASNTSTRRHTLTSFAQVDGTRIVYPQQNAEPGLFDEAGQSSIHAGK